MSGAHRILTDELNDAGLSVEPEGRCLRLSLVNFEDNPLTAIVTVPRGSSLKALRKFFHLLRANEDVYLALLQEYEQEAIEADKANAPATAKVATRTGLKPKLKP